MSMKKITAAALLLGGAFAAHSAQAACTYPLAPGKLPDGNTATRDEIKSAKDAVVKYDADMNGYLVCIRAEYEKTLSANSDATPEQKSDWERKYAQKEDAALKEVKDVVERFNEQLNVWKTRVAAEKKAS
jgi:hypothetical protein